MTELQSEPGAVATGPLAGSVARQCRGCGARVEFAATEVSSTCSYCGSSLVDVDRAVVTIEKVAPFRIERSVAEQKLREHLAGHWLAPTAIRRLRHRPRLRGVLVPFFVWDAVLRSRYQARIGIEWTRIETRMVDGKLRTRTVREVEYFGLSGSAACQVEDHLVSASTGLPEAEANGLEPFDLGWARPFDAGLLAGYEAEIPSIAAGQAEVTAGEELREGERRRIVGELLPGDRRELEAITTDVELDRAEVVALPVWIATFQVAGETLRLCVNGQTGKCVGDLPTSVGKVIALVLAIVTVIAGVVWVFARGGA